MRDARPLTRALSFHRLSAPPRSPIHLTPRGPPSPISSGLLNSKIAKKTRDVELQRAKREALAELAARGAAPKPPPPWWMEHLAGAEVVAEAMAATADEGEAEGEAEGGGEEEEEEEAQEGGTEEKAEPSHGMRKKYPATHFEIYLLF